MDSLTTLNLKTPAELQQIIDDSEKSLQELAPYNGTVPGATAISRIRHDCDAAAAELARRSS